jgi:hypothetical protein
MVNTMESSEPNPTDLAPKVVEPVAPATPDGTPPYRDPAPEELDLSGPDRSLLDAESKSSESRNHER